MKTLSLLPLLLGLSLGGCDNTENINIGGVANIHFSGTVAGGNAKNVIVQAVGINSNGQPNRDSNGEFVADVFVTDEQGHFEGIVQGAYGGSYLLVASFHGAEAQELCRIDELSGGCRDGDGNTFVSGQTITVPPTELNCPLADSLGGCKTDGGEAVSFNASYGVADDFQLWGVINQLEAGDVVSVTPLTHLAAKLALTEFVSDGLACTPATCDTSLFLNGMFTPQSIHEANSRVQQLFNIDSAFHVQTPFWSPLIGGTSSDTIKLVEQAKHGLLTLSWPMFAQQRNESLKATLDWWQASFIANEGQLLGEDTRAEALRELDLKSLYESAVAISNEQSDDNVSTAASVFNAIIIEPLFSNLLNTPTNFVGSDFPVAEGELLLDEKISQARDLVAKVQGWVADLENKEYASFFDEPNSTVMSDDFHTMSEKWALFQQQLAPDVQGLFRPMTEFVNYALSCVPSEESCDPSYIYKTSVSLIAVEGEEAEFVLSLNQGNDQFPKLYMKGKFENASTEATLATGFTFTDTVVVETLLGKSTLLVTQSSAPKVTFSLATELVAGSNPDISAIDLLLPDLQVEAKDIGDEEFQDLIFLGENISLTMVAVSDALFPNKPKHFNIYKLEIPGKIQYGAGDSVESMDVGLTIISKNAFTFYTGADDDLFPDLDFNLDLDAFKQYSQFGTVDYSTSQLGGWLEPSSDIEIKKTTSETVQYVEQFNYDSLELELKNILQLNDTQFSSGGYGALEYPGGITAWVVWKDSINDTVEMARQCLKVSGKWGCRDPQVVSGLGCGDNYGETVTTVRKVFEYFQEEGCIANVNIDGAGIYEIEYGASAITTNTPYAITFSSPITLGLSSFNLRIFSRFLDINNDKRPVAFLNVLGQILDEEDITVSVSLTHNYQGFGSIAGLSYADLVPYGSQTLHFSMEQQGGDGSDLLTYLILDGDVALSMVALDQSLENDAPIGYIRYAGSLVATIGKEGSLYVVRYVDGSWQLL